MTVPFATVFGDIMLSAVGGGINCAASRQSKFVARIVGELLPFLPLMLNEELEARWSDPDEQAERLDELLWVLTTCPFSFSDVNFVPVR